MLSLEKLWKMLENTRKSSLWKWKKKKKKKILSEPSCNSTKWLSENLVAIEMAKIIFVINKPVYLSQYWIQAKWKCMNNSIVTQNQNMNKKQKLCFANKDSFHQSHKNCWALPEYCCQCLKKVWHCNLWNWSTIINSKNKRAFV